MQPEPTLMHTLFQKALETHETLEDAPNRAREGEIERGQKRARVTTQPPAPPEIPPPFPVLSPKFLESFPVTSSLQMGYPELASIHSDEELKQRLDQYYTEGYRAGLHHTSEPASKPA